MVNANMLKGGVIVVVLLAALAAFDTLDYADNQITGAQTATDQVSCTDSDDELDDSDDGLDYYEKGKGTGLYGLDKQKGVVWGENSNKCSARWDTSLGYTIHYDCCLDAYTSKQLNEAYCDENGLLVALSYQCPRGCRDGICETDDDVVIDEQQVITRNDYFVVMTPNLGERMFRYISAVASTDISPKIELQDLELKDLGSGSRVDVDYKAASGAAGTGTEDATLKFGGGTFKIWNDAADTSANFNLRIDLNGDGKLRSVYPPARCSEGEKAVIRQGETKRYFGPSDKVYEITADFVSSLTAKFTVNGEVTPTMTELGETSLSDGNILKTFTTVVDKQPYGMQFCLQKGEAEQAGLATTNTLTLKADSFSAVALGAAFGSYYDAGKSTCKTDDIFLVSWVYAPSTEYNEETGESYESPYENVLLFDIDENNKLKLKAKRDGHILDIARVTEAAKAAGKIQDISTIEAAGAWILNEGPECTLAFGYDERALGSISAKSGLLGGGNPNFASVAPQMVGKSLGQVGGECEVIGAYANYNGVTNTWDFWTAQHVVAQNEIGLGMWLYVEAKGANPERPCALDLFKVG